MPEQTREQLRDAVQNDPGVQALEQLAGSHLPSELTDWLAQLVLLYGVPFENLVPVPAMLPAARPASANTPAVTGSIRFFYIDRNWMHALMDGAFSISAHSSMDTRYHTVLQHVVREATERAAVKLRRQLRGEAAPPANSASRTNLEPAGFLMRSEVVSGWPGLEVQGYRFEVRSLSGFAANERVSANGPLELHTHVKTASISLSAGKDNVRGLAEAINAANAGVRAEVTDTKAGEKPLFLSVAVNNSERPPNKTPLVEVRTRPGDTSSNIVENCRLELLRMDRPAPDLLLCIFDDIPDRIEINEPAEDLHFGVEPAGQGIREFVSLRNPESGVNFIPPRRVEVPWRNNRPEDGVVEIAALAGRIREALGAEQTREFGPADFGVQMVNSPDKQFFELVQQAGQAAGG